MKKYIIAFVCILSLLPLASRAESDVRGEVKVDANANIEHTINMRRLELQKKLWGQEAEERRGDYQEKREAYRNASEENKKILRGEFREALNVRCKFALDRLSSFQTRLDARLDEEANAGVDTSKARMKLDESISFMVSIRVNIDSFKALMEKDYTESEREAKQAEAKVLFEKIKADVKASHMALKASLMELRAAKKIMVETNVSVEADMNQ